MKRGGSVSGAVSLVMIFCVLCLAVFSVLTLATAVREENFAELAASSASGYYEADRRAAEIVAALRDGAPAPEDVEITFSGESTIYFSDPDNPEAAEWAEFAIPAGGDLMLEVRVRLTEDGGCEILRWSTVYAGDWVTDEDIELFDFDF